MTREKTIKKEKGEREKKRRGKKEREREKRKDRRVPQATHTHS